VQGATLAELARSYDLTAETTGHKLAINFLPLPKK
jgi:hypothetical protein